MRNLLVVKVGPIGDVVMALPMLVAADGARVTWICGRSCVPLLERVRGVELEIVEIDDRQLLAGSRLQRMRVVLSAWRRLRGRRFDLAAIGHAHPGFAWLIRGASVAEVRRFTFDRPRPWPVPGRHHANEYVRLVTGVDGPEAISPPYPAFEIRPCAALPPRTGSRRIAVAAGGAKNPLREDHLRRWPLANYRAVADALVARGDEVVLVGGPDDAWVRSGFAGCPVRDLIGATPLAETVDLFAACDAVLTHDSGPMHLADLARAPLVAIFGPTMPAEKLRQRPDAIALWGGAHLACRPCYDGIAYAACPRNVCMEAITPADALAALDRAMGQRAAAPA